MPVTGTVCTRPYYTKVPYKISYWNAHHCGNSNPGHEMCNNPGSKDTFLKEVTQVTVYFESYCPDSVKFLTTQLFPAYASPLKEYMNVTLVPYGKAKTVKTAGEYTFSCHHGEKECVGNKVIACVLKDKSVPLSEHFKFINCTSFSIAANVKVEEYPVKMCATRALTSEEILDCASGSQGSEYLAEYGNITNEFTTELKSVPTVVFNDKFVESESKMAVSDFRMALCSKMVGGKPAECMKNSATSLHVAVIPLVATLFAIFRI